MPLKLTKEQIVQLAPDEASVKAAKGLATTSKWGVRQFSDRCIWGHCQGSGKNPYQTAVDITDIAFKCSCPSRKFPCKHALGLLFLYESHADGFEQADEPDWVKAWLDKRAVRAEKKEKPGTQAAPVDEEAKAKRLAKRHQNVMEGIADLEVWMKDLLRNGLVNVPERAYSVFEAMAKRMVDAQAPGLAARLKAMADIDYGAESWKHELTDKLSKLFMVISAYRNVDRLPADWQDEIYQEAFGTDNNLSVSGSIKDVLPYSVSLGYLNEKGILKTGKMERMTASVNLNPRLFDNHLKIDVSVKGSKINNRFANTDAIQTAVSFDPTQPVKAQGFDKYGGYFTWLLPDGSLKTQAPTNPALLLDTYSNTSRVYRAITNAQIDYRFHFFEDMHAVLNLGYDYSDGEGLVQVPEWAPQMASRNGQYMEYASSKKNKLLEFYLNYTKDVPAIQSSFDVTAGYTYQDWLTHTDNFTDYSATGEEVDVPDFPFDETRVTLISAFGRLNYSLMDKYLLTATVRRDGSSRFHPDTRWGTFPSVALAWRLKEEFLKDADKVDELKLRVGYGQTGQQDIYQYYPYLSRYEVSSNVVQQQFGDKYYYMYRPSAYDSEIKWETTETWNAAVDFGFFDNRLSGSLDFYIKKTKDLLATVSVPAGSNFSNQLISNVGSLENKGFELTLNADLIRSKDWNWTASFNIAYNNNKVTKLTLVDSDDYEGIPQGWIFGSTGGTVQIHSVGYNTFSYYLYKQVYDENGRPLEGVYEDLNHDGRINSDDLYRTKSAEPKVTMGLSTSLSYKDWTLSTTLRGSFGNYVYNNMNSGLATYSNILSPSQAIMNAPRNVLESGFYLGQPLSDYYLENASFVKMDNLSLTYDFGRVFKEKIGITGTLMVQNVFTITKYSGIDPEIAGGVDRSFYPRPRIFMLGFNINY